MNTKLTKKLIVANWKMNGYSEDASKYLEQYFAEANSGQQNSEIVICPPFTLLNIFAQKSQHNNISIGGQDCHEAQDGAYTGSISAKMLKNIGCDYVILGHSERRSALKESNKTVSLKAKSAQEQGLKTVICVGETLDERENNMAEEVVKRQILQSMPDSASNANTVIAYEPIWAIGSGKIPSLDDIEKMHSFIKQVAVKELPYFDEAPKILYGGSVKSTNSASILATNNVDGLLVGKASLDAQEFCKIIRTA